MWKVGRALVALGYLGPLYWVGWIITQRGVGSLGSGLLGLFQLCAVIGLSLASLVCGSVLAAIGWRRATSIRPSAGYLVVGAGALGAVVLAVVLTTLLVRVRS